MLGWHFDLLIIQCGNCCFVSIINITSLSLDISQSNSGSITCINCWAQSSVLRSGPCYTDSQGEVPKCFSELHPELWPVHTERWHIKNFPKRLVSRSYCNESLLWESLEVRGKGKGCRVSEGGNERRTFKFTTFLTFPRKLHGFKLLYIVRSLRVHQQP